MRVAIIPARGGSKRITRKNIRPFRGKPLIAYSIECALRSGLFESVLISTDDEEIAATGREYGAQSPFRRPAPLSDDYATTTDVIAHAVQWLKDAGKEPRSVCCIYATAPFIRVEDLRRALDVLESGQWQFVFPATTYAAPIFRSFKQNADGGLQMFFPEHLRTRSQDLPEALHDAGQFYWGTTEAWLRRADIFGSSSTVVKVPRWRVQDIDTPDDWERMELLASLLDTRA